VDTPPTANKSRKQKKSTRTDKASGRHKSATTSPLEVPSSPSSRPIISRSSSKAQVAWTLSPADAEKGKNERARRKRAETLVLYCKFLRLKKDIEDMGSSDEDS